MLALQLALMLLAGLVALFAWLLLVESPRLASLLAEVRTQQHARALDGEDDAAAAASATAAAHAESLQFVLSPLSLAVSFRDADDGSMRTGTGVAEVLTVREPEGTVPADRPVFLMVPGNPGLVQFYKLFIMYMHRLTKGKVEFRCVSFVGHTSVPLNSGVLLPFPGQLAFFQQVLQRTLAEVGPHRKVFLAGHSVGAYTLLHMLRPLTPAQASQVARAFMLFPTVTDIASTPNGRTHTPVLRYLRPLACSIVSAVALLPQSVLQALFRRFVGLNPYEVAAAQGLLVPGTARACLTMAHEEMQQIGPLDFESMLRPHLGRLFFLWGHRDAWAPLTQLEQLKRHFGEELQYRLAHPDAAHAFVVGGSHLVAPVLAEQMKPFL